MGLAPGGRQGRGATATVVTLLDGDCGLPSVRGQLSDDQEHERPQAACLLPVLGGGEVRYGGLSLVVAEL